MNDYSKQPTPKQPTKAGTTQTVHTQVDALCARALRFIAPGRIEGLLRQWGKSHSLPPIAAALAATLATVTHATNGTTAFDRMTRAGGHAPEDNDVLAGLRKAQYRIIQQTGAIWRDIVTNETLPMRLPKGAETSFGTPILCVVAPMPDGTTIIAGMPVPLDLAAMAVARPFIRPGARGLSNPVHCAELVYRHVLVVGIEKPVLIPEANAAPPKLPFRPDTNPIDAIAADWAGRLDKLTEQDLAKARPHTDTGGLLKTLTFSDRARDAGLPNLADAYARIALVMMETYALRHRIGSGSKDLDDIADEMAAILAEHGVSPHRTRALFDTLRARLKIAPAAGRIADSDLDKLVQRIRGLRAKTVDQGCTEPEAMAAAAKVAELLDRHGLTMSELDLRRQNCEGIGIDTGRKRRAPIDSCKTTIGAFFDCRVWSEVSDDDTIRYVFFGLPGDVDGAVYLNDLVTQAFETETRAFQEGPLYRDTPSGDRRTATNSFQIGLGSGIRAKLGTLQAERDAARRGSSGRDLVPVKQSILAEELEKLGLNFVSRSAPRPRRGVEAAFGAGKEAGERFEYRAGIEA